MAKFIIKTVIAASVFLSLHLYAAHRMGGTADTAYLKLTAPQQQSLILGSSRAAQGIRPDLLNKHLPTPIYNFAFTMAGSPYGPVYLDKIQQMVLADEHPGLFVVEVNPWVLGCRCEDPEDPSQFREHKGPLSGVSLTHDAPNYSYLVSKYDKPWGRALVTTRSRLKVMPDGWLRVNVNMNDDQVAIRAKRKEVEYKSHLAGYQPSNLRLEYLKKTVAFLVQHGEVVLVRLPVPAAIAQYEAQLDGDFGEKMQAIAAKFGIEFLDYTESGDSYQYTDGNHLYRESGFTCDLARDLRKLDVLECDVANQ